MVRVGKKNLHENANNICIVYRATGNIDPCNPIPVWKRKGPDRTLQVKWTACILRYRCVCICAGADAPSPRSISSTSYDIDTTSSLYTFFFFFFILFVHFRIFLSYFSLFFFFFCFSMKPNVTWKRSATFDFCMY